jgi:putative membrane protein
MPEETIRTVRRVFHFPVLGRLWRYVAGVAVYSALVVTFGRGLFPADPAAEPARTGEMVVAGILFGWLMNFRTQAAYARWWDGRGLWGQLVNDTRNLVLKAGAYVREPEECRKLAATLVRFAETLRDHLRLPKGAAGPHRPMAVAEEVFGMIRGWEADGRVDGFAFLALDEHARQLMNVCGACEKIRATPLAASYRGLLRKGIAGYVVVLPWFIADEVGWLTVPAEVLIAYAVIALELIATGIEDPFGTDGDDLPLDDIVETIRRSVAGGRSKTEEDRP